MIPIGTLPQSVPTSKARVRRRILSSTVLPVVAADSPGVRMLVVNLAEATRAALTKAPETFGVRLARTRSPVG